MQRISASYTANKGSYRFQIMSVTKVADKLIVLSKVTQPSGTASLSIEFLSDEVEVNTGVDQPLEVIHYLINDKNNDDQCATPGSTLIADESELPIGIELYQRRTDGLKGLRLNYYEQHPASLRAEPDQAMTVFTPFMNIYSRIEHDVITLYVESIGGCATANNLSRLFYNVNQQLSLKNSLQIANDDTLKFDINYNHKNVATDALQIRIPKTNPHHVIYFMTLLETALMSSAGNHHTMISQDSILACFSDFIVTESGFILNAMDVSIADFQARPTAVHNPDSVANYLLIQIMQTDQTQSYKALQAHIKQFFGDNDLKTLPKLAYYLKRMTDMFDAYHPDKQIYIEALKPLQKDAHALNFFKELLDEGIYRRLSECIAPAPANEPAYPSVMPLTLPAPITEVTSSNSEGTSILSLMGIHTPAAQNLLTAYPIGAQILAVLYKAKVITQDVARNKLIFSNLLYKLKYSNGYTLLTLYQYLHDCKPNSLLTYEKHQLILKLSDAYLNNIAYVISIFEDLNGKILTDMLIKPESYIDLMKLTKSFAEPDKSLMLVIKSALPYYQKYSLLAALSDPVPKWLTLKRLKFLIENYPKDAYELRDILKGFEVLHQFGLFESHGLLCLKQASDLAHIFNTLQKIDALTTESCQQCFVDETFCFVVETIEGCKRFLPELGKMGLKQLYTILLHNEGLAKLINHIVHTSHSADKTKGISSDLKVLVSTLNIPFSKSQQTQSLVPMPFFQAPQLSVAQAVESLRFKYKLSAVKTENKNSLHFRL